MRSSEQIGVANKRRRGRPHHKTFGVQLGLFSQPSGGGGTRAENHPASPALAVALNWGNRRVMPDEDMRRRGERRPAFGKGGVR